MIPVEEVIGLTNQKRIENGLSGLGVNPLLSEAARAKGEDMLLKDYWAHTSPDGVEPWKFFADVGYKYRFAGENLARDFSNAQSAVEAWMASPSHRENLLSSKYQEIGIAVVEGDLNGVDTTIIVQLFGSKYSDTAPQVPIASAQQDEVIPTVSIPTLQPSVTAQPTKPVETLTPTPNLNFIAESRQDNSEGLGKTSASNLQVLISPFKTTKNISVATTALLLVVMILDGIIVHKRKVVRISGRTFAHVAFLGMVLAIVLIAKSGSIL